MRSNRQRRSPAALPGTVLDLIAQASANFRRVAQATGVCDQAAFSVGSVGPQQRQTFPIV
jgi:hypothetical protein